MTENSIEKEIAMKMNLKNRQRERLRSVNHCGAVAGALAVPGNADVSANSGIIAKAVPLCPGRGPRAPDRPPA